MNKACYLQLVFRWFDNGKNFAGVDHKIVRVFLAVNRSKHMTSLKVCVLVESIREVSG